jgi:opacity protein-like surface antigen
MFIWKKKLQLPKRIFLIICIVSFLLPAATALAQFDKPGAKTHEGSHKHSVYFEMPFGVVDQGDLSLGLTYRHSISGEKFLGAFGSFYARPYAKAVLVKSGPNYFFQTKEYRFILAGGLDKKWWINNRLDAFVSAGLGITFVDYRGTGEGVWKGHQLEKKEGFTPVITGGFSYKFTRYVFLRSGYQYVDNRTSSGHRIYLALGGQF